MISHQVENINKEKLLKKSQIVILKLKSPLTEMKNLLGAQQQNFKDRSIMLPSMRDRKSKER